MHIRLLDKIPSAIVTAGGSEKKIYEGNSIYLTKGDNFELRFFNPLREKVGIEIIFNGQKKNDGYLVLNPGEDVILDRFLNDKKRMVFDTYMVDSNNQSAVEAAALNGIIEVNFYKERNYYNYCNFASTFNNNSRSYSTGGQIYVNTTTQEYDLSYTPDSTTYGSSINSVGVGSATPTSSLNVNENLKETGRVEKGNESNQDLNLVNIEFEITPFHYIKYFLKPLSTKTITTSEIRLYCTKCGYRLRKQNWVYCPKCGKKTI